MNHFIVEMSEMDIFMQYIITEKNKAYDLKLQ